jgi:hypothetical protein
MESIVAKPHRRAPRDWEPDASNVCKLIPFTFREKETVSGFANTLGVVDGVGVVVAVALAEPDDELVADGELLGEFEEDAVALAVTLDRGLPVALLVPVDVPDAVAVTVADADDVEVAVTVGTALIETVLDPVFVGELDALAEGDVLLKALCVPVDDAVAEDVCVTVALPVAVPLELLV